MSSRQPEAGLEPSSLFAETQEFTKPNHSLAARWQGKEGGSRAEAGLSEGGDQLPSRRLGDQNTGEK